MTNGAFGFMTQGDAMKGRIDPEQVLGHLPDGLVVLDETGRILYANAKVRDWTGGRDSLKGKSCFRVFRQRMERCPNCGALEGKNGRSIETACVLDEDDVFPKGMEVIATDGRNRLGPKQTVLLSFRQPLSSSSIDEKEGQTNLQLQGLNEQLRERVKELDCLYDIAGPAPLDWSTQDLLQFVANRVPASWYYSDQASARIRLLGMTVYSRNYRPGHWRMISDIYLDGETAGSLEIHYPKDVTEDEDAPFLEEEHRLLEAITRQIEVQIARKRSEEALQVSQENLRLTLRSIADGVITINPQGRITRLNPKAEKLTGWSWTEAVGRPLEDVFQIENTKAGLAARELSRRVVGNGETVELGNDTQLHARDGVRRQIGDSAAPVRDRTGTIIGGVIVFSDVTAKHQAQKRLEESEENFRLLAENARDLIYRIRLKPEMAFEYVSPAATMMTGYTPEEHYEDPMLGFKIIYEPDRDKLAAVMEGDYDFGEPLVLRWQKKDGSIIWVEQKNVPIFDEQGEWIGLEGIARDITKRKQDEAWIRYLSFHDVLTGLNNRAYLQEAMDRLTSERQLPMSIIMADLNGLKLVNDTFGHQVGDQMLIEAAELLRECCRKEDIIVRFGGDEFVILLPQADEATARAIAKRLTGSAQASLKRDTWPVSMAIGYSVRTDLQQGLDELIGVAEDDMYQNKKELTDKASTALLERVMSIIA